MQRISSVFGLLVLALATCGTKKASPDGGAGSTGADAASTAGSSGATAGAGAIGVAGTPGNGGAAGAPATGVAGQGAAGTGVAGQGAAGSAGGGASGAGGGAGAAGGATGAGGGAECQTTQDCMLASDCCACRAEPKGRPVDSCPAICTVDVCRANEIQQHEVACVHGRCVLARSCDTTRVACIGDPPACPPGTVHSVRDSCWGPCLLPTECSAVTECGTCGAGRSVCGTPTSVGNAPPARPRRPTAAPATTAGALRPVRSAVGRPMRGSTVSARDVSRISSSGNDDAGIVADFA